MFRPLNQRAESLITLLIAFLFASFFSTPILYEWVTYKDSPTDTFRTSCYHRRDDLITQLGNYPSLCTKLVCSSRLKSLELVWRHKIKQYKLTQSGERQREEQYAYVLGVRETKQNSARKLDYLCSLYLSGLELGPPASQATAPVHGRNLYLAARWSWLCQLW